MKNPTLRKKRFVPLLIGAGVVLLLIVGFLLAPRVSVMVTYARIDDEILSSQADWFNETWLSKKHQDMMFFKDPHLANESALPEGVQGFYLWNLSQWDVFQSLRESADQAGTQEEYQSLYLEACSVAEAYEVSYDEQMKKIYYEDREDYATIIKRIPFDEVVNYLYYATGIDQEKASHFVYLRQMVSEDEIPTQLPWFTKFQEWFDLKQYNVIQKDLEKGRIDPLTAMAAGCLCDDG